VADIFRTLADNPGLVRRFISSPLAAVRGFQKMRDILGLLIFAGVGVLIAAAVFWYITVVIQWWRANDGPPSMGAVTILGLDDSRTRALGGALPAMVLAELRRVGGRTNEAKRQLRELEPQSVPQDPRFAPVPIPESLKTEVAIPQQIAGVEIGWLLSWIKDFLAPKNVIDLTVSFEGDGKKASMFGHAKGKTGYAFYFQDETGRPDEIARAAAAAIIQHEQRRGEIAVQPLPPSQYLPFVEALSTYATYEKVIRSWKEQQGRPDFTSEYKTQLSAIGGIAEKNTQWAELQWLAAEIAERADDRKKALAFTVNEQRLTPRDDPRYNRLAARLVRFAESTVASTSTPDALRATREASGKLPAPDNVAPIKKFMGVPDHPQSQAGVRIGSILAPWPEALKTGTTKVLGEATNQNPELTDYATIMLQIKRMIAPDATFEFASVAGESLSEVEILKALKEIASSKPNVLVYAFSRGSETTLTVLRQLATDTVVVVAAGNDGGTSEFDAIDDVALVVGATDLNGSKTAFSSSSPRGVWAPGDNIPIISPVTGELSRGAGTSYSAALVGGAAALLKGAYPNAKPQDIVRAIRESAKAPAPGALRVVNVTAALTQLLNTLKASGRTTVVP
jgi:Subtilase family